MTAVSVTVYKDNLYVLDEKEGVLIYVLGQDNIFVFEDVLKLPLSTSSSYLQILSYNNNFFVVAKVEDESFVCEFQLQGKEYYLVRYYKHYSAINQILIIDSMLAIVASTSIDLFSFNRDPRTITSLDNGFVSYHIHSPL